MSEETDEVRKARLDGIQEGQKKERERAMRARECMTVLEQVCREYHCTIHSEQILIDGKPASYRLFVQANDVPDVGGTETPTVATESKTASPIPAAEINAPV